MSQNAEVANLHEVQTGPKQAEPDPATGLVIGIVVLTVVAGVLEIIQRLRGSGLWPVPLVIYATLLPIVTFVIVVAGIKESFMHPGYLIAAWAPLPFIVFAWRASVGKGASGADLESA